MQHQCKSSPAAPPMQEHARVAGTLRSASPLRKTRLIVTAFPSPFSPSQGKGAKLRPWLARSFQALLRFDQAGIPDVIDNFAARGTFAAIVAAAVLTIWLALPPVLHSGHDAAGWALPRDGGGDAPPINRPVDLAHSIAPSRDQTPREPLRAAMPRPAFRCDRTEPRHTARCGPTPQATVPATAGRAQS